MKQIREVGQVGNKCISSKLQVSYKLQRQPDIDQDTIVAVAIIYLTLAGYGRLDYSTEFSQAVTHPSTNLLLNFSDRTRTHTHPEQSLGFLEDPKGM